MIVKQSSDNCHHGNPASDFMEFMGTLELTGGPFRYVYNYLYECLHVQ